MKCSFYKTLFWYKTVPETSVVAHVRSHVTRWNPSGSMMQLPVLLPCKLQWQHGTVRNIKLILLCHLIHCTQTCPGGTAQDFVLASSLTEIVVQCFAILTPECVEMDDKYGKMVILHTCSEYNGFLSVPMCVTVSEGAKGIQNKTKAINWGLLRRERSPQKFFHLHPLSILGCFYVLLVSLCVPTTPVIERA